MKKRPPHRIAAMLALGCALLPLPAARGLKQEDASAVSVLLSRARTLEQRGRLDLARQDWSQVLLANPNDAEALAGMVRAARAEGHSAEADKFLARLRAAHPESPELARLGVAGGGQPSGDVLSEAAKLAHGGDPRGAMVLYRRAYGMNPPPGAPALAYYGTEAETDDGRPHAIAGLRALIDRFPDDARYQVALGRVLLRSTRTRGEGRTILEALPGNSDAVAALRGAPVIGAAGVPGGTEIAGSTAVKQTGGKAAEPATHTASARVPVTGAEGDRQVTTAAVAKKNRPAAAPARTSASVEGARPSQPAHSLYVAASGTGRHPGNLAEEQAAFAALNEHRNAEAEQMFRGILGRDPRDARALAGMGYLRQAAGDLKAAVMFFEQAQESGDRSLALTRAIVNAQFELAVKQAAADRTRGDLPGAEAQYRSALRERPNDPEALEGLGATLLQGWRFVDAIGVYDRLTHVRPLDPAAWRGLVMAEASAGRGSAALSTDAQVPAGVRSPLLRDGSYQRALAVARDAQGTQVARVEPPPRPVPPLPPPTPPAPGPIVPQPAVAPSRVATAPASTPNPAAPSRSAGTTREKAIAPASPPAAPVHKAGAGSTPKPNAVPAPAPAPKPAAPTTAPGTAPAEAETLQQADAALLHGRNAEAAAFFRAVASRDPERAEGWRGLLLALHNGGQEAEAAVVLERIPAPARNVLDRDASFQEAAGAVLLASRQPNEALRAYVRAQDVFSSQRLTPPLGLVMDIARLLAARGDDENLYRELMYLGERRDLTDVRRVEVQMIWTRWAVRRARALAAAGDDQRAVTLLNAAATAFAGNADVLHAVADGYVGIGRPREAVALYRTEDLSSASVATVAAAVRAATVAHDFHTAENWMHLGLQRFANDAQMLNTAAELAQARGHEKRAVELSQQAKSLVPAQNPGQVLAAELKEAPAGEGWPGHNGVRGQLGVLLAPADVARGQAGRPYLPTTAVPPAAPTAANGLNEPPLLAGFNEPSR